MLEAAATAIIVMTPGHEPGRVDVVASNPDGQSAGLDVFLYLYGLPMRCSTAPTAHVALLPASPSGKFLGRVTRLVVDERRRAAMPQTVGRSAMPHLAFHAIGQFELTRLRLMLR